MNWFTAILLYVVIWWLILFMVLPWGVRSSHEAGVDIEPGHDKGAPVNPRIWLKTGLTTLIATTIMAFVLASVQFEWIDYRSLLALPG
jgi:predicted secreted protein